MHANAPEDTVAADPASPQAEPETAPPHQRGEQARDAAEQLSLLKNLRTADTLSSRFLHELAQPLAAITLYAKTCQRMADSGDFDRRALRETLARIERLAEESGEILQRQRLLSGPRPALSRKQNSINALIGAAAHLVVQDCRSQGIALELALDDDLPPVDVTDSLIELVLLNLIRNARESIAGASACNSGRIQIRSKRLSDDLLAVTIIDNGAGIPPEDVDRILEPFHSGKTNAIGMGLPISRGVIESLGGTLTVKPASRGGAEFTFTLPVSQSNHAA